MPTIKRHPRVMGRARDFALAEQMLNLVPSEQTAGDDYLLNPVGALAFVIYLQAWKALEAKGWLRVPQAAPIAEPAPGP